MCYFVVKEEYTIALSVMEIIKELYKRKNLRYWFYIFLISTGTGLWNFGIIVTTRLIGNESLYTKYYLLDELTGAYSGFVLLPFILWVFYKYPIKKKFLLTRIPIHILTSMIFGICGTVLMTISRTSLYNVFDMGTYDPGNLFYRFLMEYHKQLFWYWIIYAGIYILNSFRETQKQKLKEAELKQELTKATLQALQTQINPHFLFNTLNMISSIMYDNPKAADKMIANLSDLMRRTLHNNSEKHSLEKELELLEIYSQIMKARFQNKLDIKFDIEDETKSALVPWFIIQPLLENSIKHSMDHVDQCEVKVSSVIDNDKLVLSITDNGPGITDKIETLMKKGVGISNIINRLEKLYDNYDFKMENVTGGGLAVSLVISFEYEDK